jgi:hypothetical protein
MDVVFSYNKKEAEENIKREKKKIVERTEREPAGSVSVPTVSKDSTIGGDISEKKETKNSIVDDLLLQALHPTKQSLSAFGSIFYSRNLVGGVFSALTIATFLFSLLPLKILRRRGIQLYLLSASFGSLAAFVVFCLSSEVETQWGLWFMAFTLFAQLVFELRIKRLSA